MDDENDAVQDEDEDMSSSEQADDEPQAKVPKAITASDGAQSSTLSKVRNLLPTLQAI
jgi:hypothetical protein